MDIKKPISIQNVKGNVTVTVIDGNNNQTQVHVDEFTRKFALECGLRLIYDDDDFKKDSNTSVNFKDWLNGFQFNLKSICYEQEYRRNNLLSRINTKLENNNRLLILGASGTSKSVILMEVLCDYLKHGYRILHNLDIGSVESSSAEIKNLEYIENTILGLVERDDKVLVVVDNVHNTGISNIFSLIKKLRDDDEDKFKQIKFLLSARQPEFGWAKDRGLFDTATVNRIDMFFEKEKEKYITTISNFELPEVEGFIEKYKGCLHDGIKHKSTQENTNEIFKDTEGHPIMVRFSALNNGLIDHVKQMYRDYLLENNAPNIERIKAVIVCSLYDIPSIPLKEETLYDRFDLKNQSLEIIDTMIKRTGDFWTTIHPRWDLELFRYMFSLNEADRERIQEAFRSILLRILEFSALSDKLTFLNTIYNSIASGHFIKIEFIRRMLNSSEIEKKLDPVSKVLFFAHIEGVAFDKLKDYDEAIRSYDEAIRINPEYADAYYNKGNALSALGRNEEAIRSYDEAIRIDPEYAKYANERTN